MEPIDTHPRQRLLDVLRGTAILGTLLTNVWCFVWIVYLNAAMPQPTTLAEAGEAFDTAPPGGPIVWLAGGCELLANGKFLAMLAIVLGIGLQLSQMRAVEKGQPWLDGALRRYAVLLLLGVAHYLLVFEWDILFTYGLAALAAVFAVRCGTRGLLVATLAAGALFFVWVAGWLSMGVSGQDLSWFQWEELRKQYAETSYLHQVQYRFDRLSGFALGSATGVPGAMLLILLGAWMARFGVFATPSRQPEVRAALAWAGLGVALPLTALVQFSVFDSIWPWLFGSYTVEDFYAPTNFGYGTSRYLLAPLVGLGYMAAISIAVERGWSGGVVTRLGEVGRVPLTCYVLQNVLVASVYLGWGLGMVPTSSGLSVAGVLVATWATLLGVAWLAAERRREGGSGLGPLEWLWRAISGLPRRGDGSSAS